MPTYQYRCTECATELEVVQRFSDEPLSECPECGASLRKVYSAVGVVFKGSGFYATDSRKTSKATSPAKPAESAKSEKKPAADTTASTASTTAA